MTVSQLINELKNLDPNLDVMSADKDNSGIVSLIESVRVKEVNHNLEYPKEDNMDKGYRFVRLG